MVITLSRSPTLQDIESERLSILLDGEFCICGRRFEVIKADWPEANGRLAIACPDCAEIVSEGDTGEELAIDFYDNVYLQNATHLQISIPF